MRYTRVQIIYDSLQGNSSFRHVNTRRHLLPSWKLALISLIWLCSLQYAIPSAQALVRQEWYWVKLHTIKPDVFTDISSSVLTIIILNKKLILYLATAYFVLSHLCSINSFISDKHLPVCFCYCLCLSSELTFFESWVKNNNGIHITCIYVYIYQFLNGTSFSSVN